MRRLLALIALAVIPLAAGETPLFNGRDLEGWTHEAAGPVQLPTLAFFHPDGVIAFPGKPVSFIATAGVHKDYRLHLEWRWPEKPGNGGVLVHITSGPKDRAWPECFQVQLKHQSAGDLLPMAGATFAEPLTSAPGAATAIRAHQRADSEKPPGEWNECDIVCSRDTITVTVNGVPQNRVTGCSAAGGRIGLQLEGAPFELRNVRLAPLE